jgi:galactarate dehydratase
LEGYTFLGYRNPDGSVGTKNVLGITTSVQCVAGFTQFVVKKIKQEILPKYPNVDDVVALNHTYGCGVAINVPAAVIPIRTIQNISTNPNFGGEVLIIGLGCEKLRPESLLLANGTMRILLPLLKIQILWSCRMMRFPGLTPWWKELFKWPKPS